MKRFFEIMAIVFVFIATFGASGVDTEGTYIPWIMAIAGAILAMIMYKLSVRFS